MTVAQASAPPQGQYTEQAALAALTLLALTPSLPEPDLLAAVEALLAPLGVGADAARAAALLAFAAPLVVRTQNAGLAFRQTARTSPARRAAYVLNAARRIDAAHGRVLPQMRAAESLQRAGDESDALKLREQAARDARFEDRERAFLAQHLNAERARADAAVRVDRAAEVYGPVLSWRSRRDQLVTAACRAADGKLFAADHPPTLPRLEDGEQLTGFPGQLHFGACRCIPGPPIAGAELMP